MIFESFSEYSNIVNEILDKLKKPIEDLLIEIEDFYLQNRMSFTAFNKEMERLILIYDFVKSVEKYTKPDDILVDLNYHVSIKNNLTIDITIERSGKKYTLSTDAIYAGGHNIQRLHYRYITKTNLPNTHNKKITDEYKAKIQKMTKIEKINSEINRYEKMISETESKIRELRKKTDEEILDDNSTWNLFAGLTWDDIIKRGAAKNYNYEPKEFYKSKDETRQHAIDSFYRQVSSKERDIILWEKEKRRLLVKLDNEINKI